MKKQPEPLPTPPAVQPVAVGYAADAARELARGRPQAAALQEPCGCPRKRRAA